MLKKLNTIFTTLIMLIALPTMAFAQENQTATSIQAETTNLEIEGSTQAQIVSENDVTDITVNNGAKVRIAQLQRSINTNINGAQIIILNLKKSGNETIDFDKLYNIVDSLELILVELEEFDYNKPANEMARDFAIHRSDAVSLTTEFRKYVNSVTTEEQREELKQEYNRVREEIRNEFSQKIREEIKQQNIAHLRVLLNRYNLDTQTIIQQVQSGEITIEQVRERLSNLNISVEKRNEISQKASEDRTRENIQVRERVEDLKAQIEIRAEQRNQILQERLEEQKERLIERLEQREQRIVSGSKNSNSITEKRTRDIQNQIEDRIQAIENRTSNLPDMSQIREREIENRITVDTRISEVEVRSNTRTE